MRAIDAAPDIDAPAFEGGGDDNEPLVVRSADVGAPALDGGGVETEPLVVRSGDGAVSRSGDAARLSADANGVAVGALVDVGVDAECTSRSEPGAAAVAATSYASRVG